MRYCSVPPWGSAFHTHTLAQHGGGPVPRALPMTCGLLTNLRVEKQYQRASLICVYLFLVKLTIFLQAKSYLNFGKLFSYCSFIFIFLSSRVDLHKSFCDINGSYFFLLTLAFLLLISWAMLYMLLVKFINFPSFLRGLNYG